MDVIGNNTCSKLSLEVFHNKGGWHFHCKMVFDIVQLLCRESPIFRVSQGLCNLNCKLCYNSVIILSHYQTIFTPPPPPPPQKVAQIQKIALKSLHMNAERFLRQFSSQQKGNDYSVDVQCYGLSIDILCREQRCTSIMFSQQKHPKNESNYNNHIIKSMSIVKAIQFRLKRI